MCDMNIQRSKSSISSIHNNNRTSSSHVLRHDDVTCVSRRHRYLPDLNKSSNATDVISNHPVNPLQHRDDVMINKIDQQHDLHQVDKEFARRHSDLLESLKGLDIFSKSTTLSSESIRKDASELPPIGSYSSFCDLNRNNFDFSSLNYEREICDDCRHKLNISSSNHTEISRQTDQSETSRASGGKKTKRRRTLKRKSGSLIYLFDSTNTSNSSSAINLNSNKTKRYNKGEGHFTILSAAKKKLSSHELKEIREFWRVLFDNIWLKDVNRTLKLRLQHVRTTTFAESSRILDSIMTYCDAKAKATKIRKHVPGENRVKHGCPEFSKTCGGYTPGGWNKLRSMGLIKDDEILPPDCARCDGQTIAGQPSSGPAPVDTEAACADPCGRTTGGTGSIALSDGPGVPGSNMIRPEKRVAVNMEGGSGFRPSARLLGEMAFQLERRILDYVFGLDGQKKRRFYGYTVSNICYMMEKESTNPDGGSDVIGRTEMTCRLRKLLCALDKYGYDIKIHADFSQEIINKYGLLPSTPDQNTVDTFGLNDPATITCLISRLSKRQSEVHNLNILLNCLHFMSTCDGRTLFVW